MNSSDRENTSADHETNQKSRGLEWSPPIPPRLWRANDLAGTEHGIHLLTSPIRVVRDTKDGDRTSQWRLFVSAATTSSPILWTTFQSCCVVVDSVMVAQVSAEHTAIDRDSKPPVARGRRRLHRSPPIIQQIIRRRNNIVSSRACRRLHWFPHSSPRINMDADRKVLRGKHSEAQSGNRNTSWVPSLTFVAL